MELYTTVKEKASFSFVEKKSEFIGYCSPARTESEAIAFVDSIKKRHSDARHNVYAYLLREGVISRYSDDGEPHGTAGVPVLDAIRKAGVTDCAVVVTRYFGGVLLGTGGLLRAYTAAAVGALDAAGVAKVGLFSVYKMTMSYPYYQCVMPLISSGNVRVAESSFAENVTLKVLVPQDAEQHFLSALTDATNARVKPEKIGEKCDFIERSGE